MKQNELKQKALGLINLMITEEQSDLKCCKIANGSYIDKNGDDYSWKKERIQVLKFINKCVSSSLNKDLTENQIK